ncbi:LysR family transcriptional regulator [Marinomonas sp.]|uniref:LysR family transcriptional regulator n=1 Tax=Marinomonas sp. TaxID=1904862 RepID=UPI003BABAA09
MANVWHLDLRFLRYFACVAEEKNLTHAAKRLRIAQPAVSRAIQRLESDLNVELFVRNARGVELTEAGRILLERTYIIFNQIQQTQNDVKGKNDEPRGVVSIGMPPTPGQFIAPALLSWVKENYPDIELHFFEGMSSTLQQRLNNNEIGLAVVHDPLDNADIVTSELLIEKLWVVGKTGTIRQSSYTLAEAAALPLIMPSRTNRLRLLIDNHADKQGLQLNIVQNVEGVLNLKSLVKEGHGYSILTYGAIISEAQQGNIEAAPIESPQINWTLGTAMRRDQSRKQAFIVVREAIHAIVNNLVAKSIWK